ncbi:MAG: hypothetical protein E6559_23505 [Pantoea sp.]|nr:hypothetical protein [Pantoea sp.]
MMQFTEEQRKALVVSLERRIKNAKRWLSSNKSIGNPEGEAIELISIYEIALAALTAEPVGYTVVTGAGNTLFRKHKPRKRVTNEAAIPVYATPPIAAPELPDGWKLVPVEPSWEMLAADGCKKHHNGQPCLHHDNRRRIWSAMLAAAPSPSGTL